MTFVSEPVVDAESKREAQFGGKRMDIGVVVALSGFGLASLLVVLIGIISAVSAVTGFKSNNDED